MASDYDVCKEYIAYKILKEENLPENILDSRPAAPIRRKSTGEKIIKWVKKNSKKYTALRSVTELENSGIRTVLIRNEKRYSFSF